MSKIHLGIIGCGWVRDQHMAGIYENAPDVEVVAACDVSKDRLDAFCSRYAVQHAFTHVDDLL
ncbi:MAG: Gfo/Idh/MocA family oxidoreductase, partial [Verrucomicrobia bacterium]|nr:Gfo/Idh/MocA family oxidoreductase [Verrucomicrobiota bacterium]